ncbi:hypothetical protein KY289_008153 [Solanum tuberosum]|nr:hypothetical protein KY289_008153 [Solanum tuberosum]
MFPKLPLICWGVGSLSIIASAIGVLLFADECITKQTRISYARMLIEVNVTKAIPQHITVMDSNGGTFMQGQEAREIKHCNKTDKGNHEIEKEQGKQNSEEITQFNLRPNAGDCVKDIGITELQWQVHYYSWTNKQHGTDRISSRIDRVFGNYEWMEKWGHVTTEYGNPSISDHCPMQLTMQITQHNVKVKFKFFNVWTEHDSFMSLVVSVWKQDYGKGSMKKVWCKLIALQLAVRQLNNKEFKYISQQIEKARYELSRIQEELYDEATDDLVEQEKEIMMKLEKWSMIEESALRQKSRTRWIQLGDANNKYFSAIIKERTQKKQIRCITSLMDR